MLWPLTAIGVLSLLLWRWTGDLRLYVWMRFFPCRALPMIFLLFPPKYSGTFYWLIAAALYAIAKLFEFYDSAIYSAGFNLSGYTLKPFRKQKDEYRKDGSVARSVTTSASSAGIPF